MTENVCAEDGCRMWYPPYPDENAVCWCREHYPEPNGGTFEHVPNDDHREELIERYPA